jgi:hypothetical protein
MADNRYKQVQAFNAPTAYDQQMVEARRRRRMAEALAQQAYVPQDVGVAPIPAAAPLVQGLQAFLSARAARKADEAEEKAGAAATRTGAELARLLTGGRLPETEAALTEVTPAGRIGPAKVEDLTEVSPAGRIGTAPTQDDIMRLAMTSGGVAAMKGNPLLAARLARMMEKPEVPSVGAVNPSDFTPASVAQYRKTGDFGALVPKTEPVSRVGKPSPGDFTPQSLAEFDRTGDYGALVPKPDRAPASRAAGAAAPPAAAPGAAPGTGAVLSPQEVAAAGFAPGTVVRRRDMVVLQAPPQAQRVSQSNKATAVKRVDQVASRLLQQMDKVKTGGFLGVTGMLSSVVDSQDAKLFESYRQQLSAAVRSALRIPGEGALSDYEQKQYNVQLPELGQSAENNFQIINSLKEQVRLAADQDAGLDEEEVIALPPRR